MFCIKKQKFKERWRITMKKTKIIASIILSLMLLFTANESILAASYSWTAVKTPGITDRKSVV